MIGAEEISPQRIQRIARQLRYTYALQDIGHKGFIVLTVIAVTFVALLLAICHSGFLLQQLKIDRHEIEPNFGTLKWVELAALASGCIGTPLAVRLSRRKLRHLCTELSREGVSAHDVMSMMEHDKDKDVSKAAQECLRLIKADPERFKPAETLVRAASVPSQPGAATLLRPTMEAGKTESEQLLRAASGSSARVE